MKNFYQLACEFDLNQSQQSQHTRPSLVNGLTRRPKFLSDCSGNGTAKTVVSLDAYPLRLFLIERDALNKWHQNSACDVCIYNFAI